MESLIGAVPFQVARASAALPAAGAYDPAPLEMMCAGFDSAILYFSYVRGGAAGAFKFKVEVSPHASDSIIYPSWFQSTLYEDGGVVARVTVAVAVTVTVYTPAARPVTAPIMEISIPFVTKILSTLFLSAPRLLSSRASCCFSIISMISEPVILKQAISRINERNRYDMSFSSFTTLNTSACCS